MSQRFDGDVIVADKLGVGLSPVYKLDILGNAASNVVNHLSTASAVTDKYNQILFSENAGATPLSAITQYGSLYGSGFNGALTIGMVDTVTNLCIDGNMEAAGVAAWPDYNSTNSKQGAAHSGAQCLRILSDAGAGVVHSGSIQAVLTVGRSHLIDGYARSDGAGSIPVIYISADGTVWSGTTSTSWQHFSFVHIAGSANFVPSQFTTNPAGTEYVEFDDITITDLTTYERVRVTPTGLVGIGIAAPTYKLDIFGGDVNIAEGQYYRYGAGILAYAQTALHNYYFGSAGNLTTTGTYNTIGGDSAGIALAVAAHGNTMWGASAGYNSSTGTYNVFVGYQSGYGVGGVYAGADNNVCVGYRTGYTLAADSDLNTLIGSSAGVTYAGDFMTAVGASALQVTTGADNTALGYFSGYGCGDGLRNVFVGNLAGRGLAGAYAASSDNVVIGDHAMYDIQGGAIDNVAIGSSAGYYNQTGFYNTFVGHQAGQGAAGYAGSNFNTAIGYQAGFDLGAGALTNTMIGAKAGENLTTGDGCVLLGYQAGSALTTENSKFYVANSSAGIGSVLLVGDFATGFLGSGYEATFAPSSFLDIEKLGTSKAITDFVELTNRYNNADMDGTGTALLFRQFYNDATPAVVSSAQIAAVTETDWTATAGTQDALLSFSTALNGTVAEKWRIASTGALSNTGALGTAYLHLKAGTATAGEAPLKFVDGATLATLEPGALEMAKYTLWFTPCDTTLRQSLDGTIFAQTQTVTVANTSSETTLIGTGRGVTTLPANYFATSGKTIRVTARGFFSSTGNATLTLTVRLQDDAAAKVVIATPAVAIDARTSLGWETRVDITCYSTGAAGDFWGQGYSLISATNVTADIAQMPLLAYVEMDTTDTIDVEVTAKWSVGGASDTITCTNLIIESLD